MHFDYFLHPTSDATFWVFVGFAIVVGMAVYLRVPGLIAKQLDARADAIRTELEDARRLREEAQELLASYQRKQRDAEAEAEEIVAMAKRSAEVQEESARADLAARLERRTALAEQRIAQAEAHAVAEVKALAADLATDAAARLIAEHTKKAGHAERFKSDLADLETKLN